MKPVFCLGAVLFGGAASYAQPTTTRQPAQRPYTAPRATTAPNNANLANEILGYERTQNADALLLAYGQAVTDPALARTAIAQLLSSYYTLRNQAQTAEQATQAVSEANLRFQVLQAAQNQVLIQQNQQILNQNAQLIKLMQQQMAKTR
ncbi:hypothetical protein EON80_29470 [bacterium]|nr:MAG: hypothetical protein EON80_29470 [bacterium]